MKKPIVALLALSLVLTACGDDETSDTSDTDAVTLTAAEREWCMLTDTSDATAFRFDQIFEGGLSLGLPMDELNAQASELRTEFQSDGMSDEEAVAAVGEALLDEPVFQRACRAAFDTFGSTGS